MTTNQDHLNLLDKVIEKALAAGADAADAMVAEGQSVSVSWRMGELEDLERSEGNDLGLRVFIGQKTANISTSDTAEENLDEMVARVIAMAQNAPEDKYAGLADPALLAKDFPDLDAYCADEPSADTLKEMAAACEDEARSAKGITNSEGANAYWQKRGVALATSTGFSGDYRTSGYGLSVAVVGGEGTSMERDYAYTSMRHFEDLESPAEIGKEAAERTLKRLNPRKVETCQVPVILDRRLSKSIPGYLSGLVNGASVARGTSLLRDKMGEQVMTAGINIVDDPHIKRGMASRPFDGEGVANDRLELIKDGVLQTWLLDTGTAKQLDLKTNGRAGRGIGGPPSPSTTNLYMEAGDISFEEMIKDVEKGFYCTEMIGHGLNMITGDYSRGAVGFWIENGEITYPVNEITVAGNLLDMFTQLTVASDLEFRYSTNAPTIRIDGLTIAGN